MNKLLLIHLIMSAAVFAANAQCRPDNSFTEAGLYPSYDSLACFVRGENVRQEIHFKNVDTVAQDLKIEWIRIDSVLNLPCGLRLSFNKSNRTYANNEIGCLVLDGPVVDTVGQYKLRIHITAKIVGLPTPIYGNVDSLSQLFGAGDYSYYVRVKSDISDPCALIDTSSNAVNIIAKCPPWQDPRNVHEIEGLSAVTLFPTPSNQLINVNFIANNAATYNVRIVNIFGQEVANHTLNVVPGLNNKTMDVSTLSAGVYIYTITDGKAVSTHRFVVE